MINVQIAVTLATSLGNLLGMMYQRNGEFGTLKTYTTSLCSVHNNEALLWPYCAIGKSILGS